MSERASVLGELRGRVARLEAAQSAGHMARAGYLPFAVPAIDTRLADGGLRLGAVHEVAPGKPGLPHTVAATLFTAGILARLPGPVLWCLSSRDLFAPGLAGTGLHPDRVIFVETYREAELLPLVEEGARFAGLAGVVGEIAKLGLTAARRLQLAAEASGVSVFLVRRAPAVTGEASAAMTRWHVSAQPSAPLDTPGLGRGRWRVELARCRGVPAGTADCVWMLEACDEAGRLAVPADLADRPGTQERPRRAAAR